jgi:HAD superfamily hydrolase (TIGR01509 family)
VTAQARQAKLAVATGPADLGLPDTIRACLFDLDGVLTQTAGIHAAAWKEMFDSFLRERTALSDGFFRPFDLAVDYEYVDGKPRYDGVRSFLASRGIELPEGTSASPPSERSVIGLGKRKNEIVLAMMRENGVEPYAGSVRYLRAARSASLRRVAVTSSENYREVVSAAGIADLIEFGIDGVSSKSRHLRGKPAPDTFLAAAAAVRVEPVEAAVFEDSTAGVAAGRSGRFGLVIGVDRTGKAEALRAHGADVVVGDLADLLVSH